VASGASWVPVCSLPTAALLRSLAGLLAINEVENVAGVVVGLTIAVRQDQHLHPANLLFPQSVHARRHSIELHRQPGNGSGELDTPQHVRHVAMGFLQAFHEAHQQRAVLGVSRVGDHAQLHVADLGNPHRQLAGGNVGPVRQLAGGVVLPLGHFFALRCSATSRIITSCTLRMSSELNPSLVA
jgi:hypothetical protein